MRDSYGTYDGSKPEPPYECPECGDLQAKLQAAEGQRQVATEMRQRFSVGGGDPSADLIAQHALEVSHSLVRWADRIDRLSQDKDEALEAVWINGCQEVSPALFAKVSKALGR